MQLIKAKMVKGAIWMVALKLTVRLIGVVSTIILARLLIPSDFGLVALGTAMLAFIETFSAFNFEAAIIQNQSAGRSEYNTAWTLNLVIAVLTSAVLVVLATPMSQFYGDSRLAAIIFLLAFGNLVAGLENIGTVEFQKNLEFDREFRLLVGQKLASFAVAIPLAFILRNYWALVFGILTGQSVRTFLSYRMHPYRPWFSIEGWRHLVHFSKWLLINNALYVLRHRSADFIIGKAAGAGQLGIFSLSYEVSNLATTELAMPIERAVYPGYAKMAADRELLRSSYFSVLGAIALICAPIAVGIAATAELFVPLLLGQKWVAATDIIPLLAIAGAVSVLSTSVGSVCTALGRPQYLVRLAGIHVAVLLPMLFFLVPRLGSVGAAWSFLAAAIVSLPIQLKVALRILDARISDLVRVLWRPLIAVVTMYLGVDYVLRIVDTTSTGLYAAGILILAVSAGALIYVATIFGGWLFAARPLGPETALVAQIRRLNDNQESAQTSI